MNWLHIVVNSLSVLLMISLAVWVWVYHGLDKQNLPASPGYRAHQWLIGLITLLILLIVLMVVFATDPGGSDEMWLWY